MKKKLTCILSTIDNALDGVNERGLVNTILQIAKKYGTFVIFFSLVGMIFNLIILLVNGDILEKRPVLIGQEAMITGMLASAIFLILLWGYKKFLYYSKNDEVLDIIRKKEFCGKLLSHKDMNRLITINHIMLFLGVIFIVLSYILFYPEKEIASIVMCIIIIFTLIVTDTRYREYSHYMDKNNMQKEKGNIDCIRLINFLLLTVLILFLVRILSRNSIIASIISLA